MRLDGRGHPAIRATHGKTLEFSADPDITARATCVVATQRTGDAAPVAGDVRITLRAGTESFSFDARGNSSWDPSGAAVIRRSPLRLADTLATHASAAASDLPPALVATLRDPGTAVELLVEPAAAQRPCAVLFALDPARTSGMQLTAELAAADLVVAEDDDAARAIGTRVSHGAVPVEGRVLVLATQDLPGHSVATALRDVAVETVGLTPPLAAAAASPARGPLVIAAADADPRVVLRDTPAAARVVLAVPPDRLSAVLRLAAEIRRSTGGVLVYPNTAPVRIDIEVFDGTPAGSRTGYLCLDAAAGDDTLDPKVRAALTALTGWPRRRAYDAILALQSENMG